MKKYDIKVWQEKYGYISEVIWPLKEVLIIRGDINFAYKKQDKR